jgi:hypothetical protein
MTLIVKMMSGEDCPDDDTRKSYKLKSGVLDVEFARDGDDAIAWLWFLGGNGLPVGPEKFLLTGNCYVMNEAGKTISSFGVAAASDPAFGPEQAELVRNTLDALALALTAHEHRWTPDERRGFEQSYKAVGGDVEEARRRRGSGPPFRSAKKSLVG